MIYFPLLTFNIKLNGEHPTLGFVTELSDAGNVTIKDIELKTPENRLP